SDVTPLRQQYLDVKREYPDCILLFRLGDFYETFDADAEVAARMRQRSGTAGRRTATATSRSCRFPRPP
ncbi:MAG: hypothetical protein F9K34_11355, partial [Albidovulum sp.]|uniref:hypothetical protein n=1 Tax=Albidovulum sp. TaxID=1872424 RepID=UPI001327887B